MDTVIYGAGIRGQKFYDILKNHGILVKCFCDIRAEEILSVNINGEIVPVITYEKLLEIDLCQVVVGIANGGVCSEISSKLENDKIKVVQIGSLLYKSTNDIVSSNRKFIKDYHLREMQDYFIDAENNLNIFWDEASDFLKYFNMLDLTNVVELACGHGRHVNKYKKNANKIILVDILEDNIEFCKKRFASEDNIDYYVNSGCDLSEIDSESITSLFTYDAMVHFEMWDVFSYLKETKRILKNGGMALFHHSNNTESNNVTFATGTAGRNYMSKDLFEYLCNRAGLNVVEQKVIDWSSPLLDCITLVSKL
ncbi:class I SAM-dependent methyltransferase [Lacrimispora sp.]|uniref:class I SAM-dependent methyltransferase n=1 Tax=Lacrimispora sp. TaxID=2719234 RepID=UPI0028A67877|nr:class I SAM-dependent methyltransferase [Lacrimispora sp.]